MERVDEKVVVKVLPSGLISRRDFAAFVGRNPVTVAHWAGRKIGPAPVMVGGRAYYDFEAVRDFARGRFVQPKADGGEA